MTNELATKSDPSAEINHEPVAFATTLEAARFLRLSKAMVHKLIENGSVPARRFGRAVRIPWSWLHRQAQEVRK